ncbi:CubicO group peptidase (beta-lactamase class C family) [Lewinella marina]|uniref:Serine hydrolase n=1 Tax=Neolewinella marina TaxID=438751 RepID=A0A2G0CD63_9BACT|nr:serine hydrolase domain-containing protein [Neolewinella marina]NJB86907.1 CubicO group peptidase (beta-lactamase class C family) [Neolewinella marina]PHK97895.1 serine hydrolase [Neolewinella marina]
MPTPTSKRLILTGLILGTLVSLYFVPWPLVAAWVVPLPDTVVEQVAAAPEYGFAGTIVYVDQADREPEYYAADWHNRETREPATPHALFKIASIGKLYDAVAVTKLVGEGRLSLDESLAAYLPELAGRIENADRITLRMLVQHRSGIPNYTDTPGFWTDPPTNEAEALARVLDQSADFAPGERLAYSNTNYLLISLLLEKVVGYDKFRYIREVILDPLGLERTYGSLHEVHPDSVMSGYYVGVPHDIKSTDYGSMLATAADVGVFLRALNDGTLFAEGEREIYGSLYAFQHTGLVAGYQSIARYHGDIDAVVVQFTNTTDFDGYHWSLSELLYGRILKIMRGQSRAAAR